MKRTLTSLISLALVGALSAVGCSSDPENPDSSGGGNGGGGTIALEEIGQKNAEVFCGAAFSCCTAVELPTLFEGIGTPKDEAECVQTFKGLFDGFALPGFKDSIAEGRIVYDGDKAASCFDNLPSDCSIVTPDGADPLETSPDCQAIFVGKVANGGDCAQDDDCAVDGSDCMGASNGMLGKCQLPGDVGAACMFGSDCKSDYCDFQTSMCAAKKALGEMCSGSQSCMNSYCDVDTKLCAALKADGDACLQASECQSDNCDLTTDKCVAAPAPICDGM